MSHNVTPLAWLPKRLGHFSIFLLLALMLGIAFVLSHVAYAVVKVVTKPLLLAQENAALLQEKNQLAADKLAKERKLRWINSPEGILYLGRINGMVKRGEHRVNIVVAPPKQPVHGPLATTPLTESERLGVIALIGLMLLCGGLAGFLYRKHRAMHGTRAPGGITPRTELLRQSHSSR